jgi:hypothetical protein
MTIDDLTIGEARRLAAALAPLLGTPPAPASILAGYIGKHVVVRDHRAGVYWGRVERAGEASLVLAAGARQGWRWHADGDGATAGLAIFGPKSTMDTRYTAPSVGTVYLCDIVSICETSQIADTKWAAMPVWGGR